MDKVSLQSGKASKSINYHNDRKDMEKKTEEFGHIDKTRTPLNQNWHREGTSNADCYERFYEREFASYIKKRKAKGKYTVQDMIKSRKTSPHEDIWQIGNCLDGVSSREKRKKLVSVFNDYMKWQAKTFPQATILSMDLHMDEKTPHIHVQTCFWAVDENGNKYVNQNDSLKQMGYELPKEGERSRHNNRISVFTAECRSKFIEIAKEKGLEIDTEVRYGEKHLDKLNAAIRQTERVLLEKEETIAYQDEIIADKDKIIEDAKRKKAEIIKSAYEDASVIMDKSDYMKGFEAAMAQAEQAEKRGEIFVKEDYDKAVQEAYNRGIHDALSADLMKYGHCCTTKEVPEYLQKQSLEEELFRE